MFLVPVTRSSSELARSFDRLFDDSFDRFFAGAPAALRSPSLDVSETESGYQVALDLPGVAKEDVKVTIDGRHVSVSARAQSETAERDLERKGERVLYRERSTASFARSFTLPEEVDQDASQAKLDQGVLSLTLAKKRMAAAKPLAIN